MLVGLFKDSNDSQGSLKQYQIHEIIATTIIRSKKPTRGFVIKCLMIHGQRNIKMGQFFLLNRRCQQSVQSSAVVMAVKHLA